MAEISGGAAFAQGLGKFCLMFAASSAIGVIIGVLSAVTLKVVDLRKTPSLEIALMLIFSYLPYGLAEGMGLSGVVDCFSICAIPDVILLSQLMEVAIFAVSCGLSYHTTSGLSAPVYCAVAVVFLFSGIMAVLFAGILMSHYTHINLSPVTQMTVQQTFRTVAFMAETCVFAYLGLSIFSMTHHLSISFVLWAIVSF